MLHHLKWHIAHDPCRAGDRVPFGAVPVGTSVRLRLRAAAETGDSLRGVDVLVREAGSVSRVPMWRTDGGFEAEVFPKPEPHAAFYRFEAHGADGEELLYVPQRDGRATAGEFVSAEQADEGGWFQISVFADGFETPDWLAGAVMYQVFPDRFARGGRGVLDEGVAAHEATGRPAHVHDDWDEQLTWEENGEYDPCEFYGGALSGVRGKLSYLASLGVEVLYLNPIFEARSYHRYDTADYERIDPLLGDEDDFRLLCGEAAEHGIRIVLDAVLSHTGADSRYFSEDPASPFHAWYEFHEVADGGAPSYRCWWGDPSLPEVDERSESWQAYMFGSGQTGETSCHIPRECDGDPAPTIQEGRGILPKWLEAGASGYRLDVADEIPDDVLAKLRRSVKAAKPDAAIIGEVWEDATTKVSYGAERVYALGTSLDSVMNYPLRAALLGFAVGDTDAYQLATFLKNQQANYPEQLHRCLMNLLSSHDVERMRSFLAIGGPFKDLPREEQVAAVRAITPERDRRAADLQKMVAGLLYGLPGSPCVYYGDERGMHGGGDPFCRAPMVWGSPSGRGDLGVDLVDYYRELGKARKASRVLRQGGMAVAAFDEDALCIVRHLGDEVVFVAANRSQVDKKVAVDLRRLSEYTGAAIWDEAFEGGIATFSIPPCSTERFVVDVRSAERSQA